MMAVFRVDNIPTSIDFECDSDPVKRTLQNCKNLLCTRMGDIPYNRYCGLDSRLFDMPIEQVRRELMPEIDRLFMYEPDASVVDATAYLDERQAMIITVTVEVNQEGGDA